jgi:hypothetical protein
MSVFRDYLKSHDQEPDHLFEERDESWFVFCLLLIRLGLTVGRLPLLGPPLLPEVSRRVPDPFGILSLGVEAQGALRFVSTFLCFFVSKPPRYHREIAVFKGQYIPNFSTRSEKQIQLFESALPSFATTPLAQAKWETVAEYFRGRENETPRTQEA